jgi:hypothetical protein
LLIKRWSRDVQRKSDKGSGTPDDHRGGKIKMKRVAVRETETQRDRNWGRRGLTVLAVWMLVCQKTQGQVHKGGRKFRNVYMLGFNEK